MMSCSANANAFDACGWTGMQCRWDYAAESKDDSRLCTVIIKYDHKVVQNVMLTIGNIINVEDILLFFIAVCQQKGDAQSFWVWRARQQDAV
jgi:hypothetical protein